MRGLKQLRRQAFLIDGLASLLIGTMASLLLDFYGPIFLASTLTFSLLGFYVFVAYDPMLHIKPRRKEKKHDSGNGEKKATERDAL